jgi:hypothetical protein
VFLGEDGTVDVGDRRFLKVKACGCAERPQRQRYRSHKDAKWRAAHLAFSMSTARGRLATNSANAASCANLGQN